MKEIPDLGSRYTAEVELANRAHLITYRAVDRDSGTPVVVKALRRAASSPSVLGMLQSAVAMQRSLSGRPHSPHLLEAGNVEPPSEVSFYVVREHVAGHALTGALAPGGAATPFDVVRDILRALADYVCELESRGYRHGAIVPDNVVLSDEGEVVVLDPGMAAWLLQPGQGIVPDDVQRFVAPGYLAPPFFEDVRGDQFSIAAVADALLTPLLSRGSPEGAARVSRFRSDVVARALSPSADDRYPGAAEILAAMASGAKASPASAGPSDAAAARELLARLDTADHYGVFGVEQEASFDTIRAAYFRLFSRFHPSRASEAGMAEVASELPRLSNRLGEIYATLRDPVARSSYDERLIYEKRRQSRGGSGS